MTKATFKAWAVEQKSHALQPEDIFYTRGDAVRYKVDTFEPEHEAKIIPVVVTVTLRGGE